MVVHESDLFRTLVEDFAAAIAKVNARPGYYHTQVAVHRRTDAGFAFNLTAFEHVQDT